MGNGAADDTAALQAAIDAAAIAHETLYLSHGTYKITDTLTVVQKSSFSVRGPTKPGAGATIKWAGAQGGTMLLIDGGREIEWSDLALDGATAGVEPAVIIDIDKISAGATITRKNGFRRMLLRGGSVATVRIANTSKTNNEAHVFEDVEIAALGPYDHESTSGAFGYLVKNINAKNIQVVRGGIGGKWKAVRIEAGSLHLHSVEIGGCGTWFSLESGGEPIIIENCDGDSSDRFLELGPSQSNPITALGNRFVQYTAGDLFTFNASAGPVTLIGNTFGGAGDGTGALTTITNGGPRMVVIGNIFPNNTLLTIPTPPAARFMGLFALGNLYSPGNPQFVTPLPLDDVLVGHRASGGSYNGLQLAGAAGFLAFAQPQITLGDQQLYAVSGLVTFSTSSDITMLSTPTLRGGAGGEAGIFDGQVVTLLNVGEHAITLQDRGTLPDSGLALTAATVVIGPRQSLSFTWSATLSLWIQTGPLVAPL